MLYGPSGKRILRPFAKIFLTGRDSGMVVYHGTDSVSAKRITEEGIRLDKSRGPVDNGAGFYMTPSRDFALDRAQTAAEMKRRLTGDPTVTPAIVEIELDLRGTAGLRVKKFQGVTPEWQAFIFYNRLPDKFFAKWRIKSRNHNRDGKYDVVVDETADSGLSNLMSQACRRSDGSDLEGYIAQIAPSARQPSWSWQVSLHSKAAVEKCVRRMEIIQP